MSNFLAVATVNAALRNKLAFAADCGSVSVGLASWAGHPVDAVHVLRTMGAEYAQFDRMLTESELRGWG